MNQNLQEQSFVLNNISLINHEEKFFTYCEQHKLGKLRKNDFGTQLADALAIAKPKALFRPVTIDHPDAYHVEIDQHRIESIVVKDNLNALQHGYLYVVTCGREISAWRDQFELAVNRYFADVICEFAMRMAHTHLLAYVHDMFHTSRLAWMNPGSTRGWLLEDQQLIFKLLGDVKSQIGVELLESYFMMPVHSTSGLLFESQHAYSNCQMCARENCPSRSTPYQGDAYEGIMDCTATP